MEIRTSEQIKEDRYIFKSTKKEMGCAVDVAERLKKANIFRICEIIEELIQKRENKEEG